MNQLRKIVLIAATLISPSMLFSQWACLAPPCHPCDDEIIKPNLSVAKPTRLRGTLFDPTGAAITYEKASVQVRDSKSKTVLVSARLDEQGRFDLGRVRVGEYRFLAVLLKDGEVRRLPLADQPTDLSCSDETECNLRIVIHFHGTDNPISGCPPK
jgi:hypothetical protein